MQFMFTPERLMGIAMMCFRDRIITVLCNSPLHPTEVAVVELYTVRESFEGAICLKDIIQFAGLVNLYSEDVFVREQSDRTIELWLFNRNRTIYGGFDNDVTPTDKKTGSDLQYAIQTLSQRRNSVHVEGGDTHAINLIDIS